MSKIGKKRGKYKKKLKLKERLDKLKIWWNLAYEDGNEYTYDLCEKECEKIIGKHVDKYGFMKWDYDEPIYLGDMEDIVYIPRDYKDRNGIVNKYYTRFDVIRICDYNYVLADDVFHKLKGEYVEDLLSMLNENYCKAVEDGMCLYMCKSNLYEYYRKNKGRVRKYMMAIPYHVVLKSAYRQISKRVIEKGSTKDIERFIHKMFYTIQPINDTLKECVVFVKD